jgi:hypothetical protein
MNSILSDKETIEKLRDALTWLVYECESSDLYDVEIEGTEHEALLKAKRVLDETEDY